MRKQMIAKRHIVLDVIKNDRHSNERIIAYVDLNNRKFKSLLKAIFKVNGPIEVRSLNDFNDNDSLYRGDIRWDEGTVAMYATTKDEFHIWLGGAI